MIKKTSRWITVILISLLVFISGLILAAKVLLPTLSSYSPEIANYLSEKLDAKLSIGAIKATWLNAKPQIKLFNLEIVDLKIASRVIAVSRIEAQLDIVESVKNFAPIFKNLTVQGLSIQAEQINKRWMTVFSPSKKTEQVLGYSVKDNQVNDTDAALNKFLKILSTQSQVVFSDAQLILKPQNKPPITIGPMQFLMENTDQIHQLSGRAQLKSYGDNSSVQFAVQALKLAPFIVDTAYDVHAKFTNVSQQLLAYNAINLGAELGVDTLSLDSKVWAKLERGVFYDVIGDVAVHSLTFKNNNYPQLFDSSLHFSLDKEADKYYLSLADIDLFNGDTHIKIPLAKAVYNTKNNGFIENLAISHIDIGKLTKGITQFPFVNKEIKTLVTQLNTQGDVTNMLLSWPDEHLKNFTLSADLHRVSINSYLGAPALSGVTGLLKATAESGSIDLNTRDFSLHLPLLYENKWGFSQAQGHVSWKIAKQDNKIQQLHLTSQLLSLQQGRMRVNGRFSMLIPFDEALQSYLTLMIGLKGARQDQALSFVAPNIVGLPVTNWLQKALSSAKLERAAVVIRTGVKKNLPQALNPSVQLHLDIADANVRFDDSWPSYAADSIAVIVNNERIVINSDRGKMAGNEVTALKIHKSAKQPILKVSAQVSGDIDKLYGNFQRNPVSEMFPETLKDWSLGGKHRTSVRLNLPLQGTIRKPLNKPQVTLLSQLSGAKLVNEKLSLAFEDVNGLLNFDTQTGLSSKELKLNAFGFAAKASIKTENLKNIEKTRIFLSGGIDTKSLQALLEKKPLGLVTGQTQYNARLDICAKLPSCHQLVINSSLLGMALDLPKPWGKTEQQSRKLQVINTLEKNSPLWRYNYADLVRGVTLIDAASSVQKTYTKIALGGARPEQPTFAGVAIEGVINSLNVDALSRFASEYIGGITGDVITERTTDKNAQESQQKGLQRVDLKLINATLFGNQIASAWLNFQRSSAQWSGKFNSTIASGSIDIGHNSAATVRLKLSELILSKRLVETSTGQENLDIASSTAMINTNDWPKVALSIDKLVLDELDIGRWSAASAPTEDGYKVSDISGAIAQTSIAGEIAFTATGKRVNSFLDIQASGGDLGAVLTQLGQAKVLESKSSDVKATLSWPGYPWDIDQGKLDGRVGFKLFKGRIIEAGTSANFLRIFSILNLNSVLKRLKLDFSDLLESGVAFDKVTAKYYLQEGIATSEEPLKLEGDSASVEMTGTIDFTNQTLQQTMEVALPLSSNAPLAALLLATPQVAGIAFIVDKILGKQLAKLTALRYAVSGSWLQPLIEPMNAKAAK